MTPTPAKLSACVITCNEADRIEACLASVSFCDERVVVDSHSTDATRDLAHSMGARVIERDWTGFRSQKEYAVSIASNDWVLCIDADERVCDELRAEIEAVRMAIPIRIGWSGCSTGDVAAGTEWKSTRTRRWRAGLVASGAISSTTRTAA
jgi:glycosyltransferase involved in cell wall biosynthesis